MIKKKGFIMPTVSLISETNISPSILASHAAKTCYEPTTPQIGKTIDVKSRLFDTGHHTTLQHNYFTFAIDNISVYSVCFGLHMASPFYNTDQRSGRFSKMYDNPDMNEVRAHLKRYAKNGVFHWEVIDFIRNGLEIYADNKAHVTQLARDAIARERPNASEKYIEQNAPKFAQEQLRMFISMIAPTGMDYTINLAALAALWRTAWNPEMRDVVFQMVECVRDRHPDIAYMFDESKRSTEKDDWNPAGGNVDNIGVALKPTAHVIGYRYSDEKFASPVGPDMVDLSYFSPKYMDNSQMYVISNVEVSAATLGQDQRHRTIKRSVPEFTGKFYLPPLLQAAGLDGVANDYIRSYYKLKQNMSLMEWAMIAPYGAMVRYNKSADMNALLHEQAKRTCFCAQEEIYHLGTQLRSDLANCMGTDSKLIQALAPHCYKTGKCCEGVRFCGRDIAQRMRDNYFTDRQI